MEHRGKNKERHGKSMKLHWKSMEFHGKIYDILFYSTGDPQFSLDLFMS